MVKLQSFVFQKTDKDENGGERHENKRERHRPRFHKLPKLSYL